MWSICKNRDTEGGQKGYSSPFRGQCHVNVPCTPWSRTFNLFKGLWNKVSCPGWFQTHYCNVGFGLPVAKIRGVSHDANFFLFKPEQLFHDWLLASSRWTGCCNSFLLASDCSFTEPTSEYTRNNFQAPHLPSPSRVSSLSPSTLVTLSLSPGTLVTLSLALGRAATFATAARQHASYGDASQKTMSLLSSCFCCKDKRATIFKAENYIILIQAY